MKNKVLIFGRLAVLAAFIIGMTTAPLTASTPCPAAGFHVERTMLAMAELPGPGGELYAEAPSAEVVAEKKASSDEHLYFEPTLELIQTDWARIGIQHNLYVKAKARKDWGEARRLALYNFTRAWVTQNQVVDIIKNKEKWGDVSEMKNALTILDSAKPDLDAAEKAGHHKDGSAGWATLKTKMARVRGTIEKQIADLLAK